MAIMSDIANERAKLVKATFKSKLGKRITSDILFPILDNLEKSIPIIMEENAKWLQRKIVTYLQSVTPTGRSYRIFEYNPDAPYGQRTKYLFTHTASKEGQPPATLTGTLSDSIGYEVFSDGSFRVGLLKQPGEFSDLNTEFEYAFMKMDMIFVMDEGNEYTSPVGTYGRELEESKRPWFRKFMDSIRDELRQNIRKDVRKSLNKITRRISVRKAIVFKVYFR